MDWNSIIIALISALTGGGLTALLTLPQARKKAEGEADLAAVQPLKEANEIIREQLAEANRREDELEERRRALIAEKDALYEQVIALREEAAIVKQYLCVHGGCQLRKPSKGIGPKFYSEHRDDFELTIDNLPVNVLLREYGKRKDSIIRAAASDDGAPYENDTQTTNTNSNE